MMFRMRRMSYCLLAVGLVTLGAIGCDDSTDPSAISSLDLKPPGNLSLKDKGNGEVVLSWNTTNPEDDFEGYNIYGAQLDTLPGNLKEGVPVQLLDDAGEVVEAAKTALASFSFDTSNAHVLSSTIAKEAVAIEDAKFAALPIHFERDEDGIPILPTCVPKSGTCENVTSTTEIDAGSITSYGAVTYTMSGLTVGKKYCFLIFSVIDGGAGVSQSSSNVACITPKWMIATGEVTLPTGATGTTEDAGHYLELRDLLTACETNGKCESTLSLPSSTARTGSSVNINAASTQPASFEGYNDGTEVFICSGNDVFIRAMGYFANGFNDNYPKAPAIVYSDFSTTPDYGGGYAREGQSLILLPGYMYVIAVATDSTNTTFKYHWLWIKADSTVVRGSKVTFELMLASHTGN